MHRLPPLLLLAACSAGSTAIDTSDSATAEFCSTGDDAGLVNVDDSGGNSTSGQLELRLITDAATDPHDPMYTAFKAYTLENTDMQGVQTTGETSGDGLVHELLGAGPWFFQAAYTRGAIT